MSSAARLIGEARVLVERHESATAGLWPRATAALARQALELAMRDLWHHRAPGVEGLPFRAQFLCLGEYIRSERVAATASQTWTALSRVCHHHPYEIEPSREELRYWIEMVENFVEVVAARAPSRPVMPDG